MTETGINIWRNLRYARPPHEALRFQKPEILSLPKGVLPDSRELSVVAPQKLRDFPMLDVSPLVGTGTPVGTDFLTLDIYAPKGARSAPVMLFVHGGGFVLGNKDAAAHDGRSFARDGVICVTLNYRLGVEGFLPIPGVPTNLGLRDIIAALTWVRTHIARFGGDPENVTLFGESAGAMATANLVASPLAQGLFRRAIIQSGHGSMVREISIARRLVKKLARVLKVAPDEAGYRSVDPMTAAAALHQLATPWKIDLRDDQGFEPVFGISRFIPVIGDDVLPQHPLEALRNGVGADVQVLIGTNAEEMNLYFVPTGVRRKIPALFAKWLVSRSMPAAGAALRAYGLGRPGKRPGEAMTEALTDLVFRWPARQFAEAHGGRTHMYEFDWRSDACDGELGAAHGMELPFVFDTLDTVSGPRGLAGEHPPQALADRVHATWVSFATDGRLPWPEYEAERRMVHHLAIDRTVEEPIMPAAAFLPHRG